MNTVLIGIIITIIIVAISLLVILIKISTQSKKTKENTSRKTSTKNTILTKLNFQDTILPKKISTMDQFSLSQTVKKVFESYKALDYANKPASKLDKIEWHTWQVSLVIAMIKNEEALFITKDDALFHKLITNISKESLVKETQKIIDKYNNTVNINKTRDELSQDIVWSSKEISILFYYISKY